MSFRVLGPVEVFEGENRIDVGGPRQRRLLCALIAAEGKTVSVDRLAEQLWDDPDRPAGAAQAVRSYVARLRRSLNDGASAVVTMPPGYSLVLGDHDVDALLAQRLADEARSAETGAERAAELLGDALAQWRGEPYGEFEDLAWLATEVQRLGELRRSIVEDLFEARLASGAGIELVGELERAVGEFPLSERLRGHLMEALSRSDRTVDASRAFHAYREYLAEETGLEPGVELKQLENDIITGTLGTRPAAASGRSRPRPAGAVTFLVTDVESSTRLWAADPDAMAASLQLHDEIVRAQIESHGGYVFATAGDTFRAAFARASDAVAAAQAAHGSLSSAEWPGPTLRVRMGLHLGEAQERAGDYFGPVVNTAARVENAGHGGQIIITEAVRAATDCAAKVDFGMQRLRDVADPVRLHQLNDGDFPALRVIAENRSTVPIPATSLVGREDEIRQVRSLLLDHRIVTLTGVGGCGKTRLAIEVAEQELTMFEHGVYFADLSVVHDDEGVLMAVAGAVLLDVAGQSPLDRVVEHLADKNALVVLDNCEHVIDACAGFAAHVLAKNGEWRILVTSREFLDVPGEQVLQVPSLSSLPGEAGSTLFEERAAQLVSDFVIDDTNRETISALCEHLDGMPMAIELAAARIPVMTPAEILNRIEDRFRVLSGGRRRTRHRQRTLEAALDWSFELLDPAEQALLDASGVFRGPFDVAAIAAIAQVPIHEATDLVEALIAKSLVETVPGHETTLYRLLETVRAYAEEHLRQTSSLEAIRQQHLEHYIAATAQIATKAMAKCGMQMGWHWADTQHWLRMKPNLDAAIDWAIACDRYEDAAALLSSANSVWREQYAMRQVLDRVDTVAKALPGQSELRDRLRTSEILLTLGIHDFSRMTEACVQAGQSTNAEVRYIGQTIMASTSIVPDTAKALRLREAADTAFDPFGLWAKVRADIHTFAGEYDEALALLEPHANQALSTANFIDAGIAVNLLVVGRPVEALEIAEDHRMADSIWSTFGTISGLSYLAVGNREAAERVLLAEARSAVLDRAPGVADGALVGLAALAADDGDSEWASEILFATRGRIRTQATYALSRHVAGQIGARDELSEAQRIDHEIEGNWDYNVTAFLKDTLAAWEARTPKAPRHLDRAD